MKKINNYIIEKLHIDKDTKVEKINKDDFSEAIMNYITGKLHYEYDEDYNFKIINNVIKINFLYNMDRFSFNNFVVGIVKNLEENFKDNIFTYSANYSPNQKIINITIEDKWKK